MHKEAVLKSAATKSVASEIDIQLQCICDHQRYHRQKLIKLLYCIKYLACQGLHFCGHQVFILVILQHLLDGQLGKHLSTV